MSDDIVKRLRDAVDIDANEVLNGLLDDAADEIERLRAALSQQYATVASLLRSGQTPGDDITCLPPPRILPEAADEIERLRDEKLLLRELFNWCLHCNDFRPDSRLGRRIVAFLGLMQ